MFSLAALLPLVCSVPQDAPSAPLAWSELAALPDAVGRAGPFAGVSGGALVVAGGANFPGGRPWEGHAKVWHADAFVSTDGVEWTSLEGVLPRAAAYGVALTHAGALVCIGGGDAGVHHVDAFLLRWDGVQLARVDLPALPRPVAFAAGAVIGDTVFVAGGFEVPEGRAESALDTLYALDLSAAAAGWRVCAACPGAPRALATAGVFGQRLIVAGGVSGARVEGAFAREYLRDAWSYDPGSDAWTRLADLPHAVAGGPAPAAVLGPSHLLFLGGDDGTRGGGTLRDAHRGFRDDGLLYHGITDTWRVLPGVFPKDLGPDPALRPADGVWPTVTVPLVEWDGGWVVPSGEARPGVRSARVRITRPRAPAPAFRTLDWIVLCVYLGALVAMGFWFARRERSTRDFFLASGRIPWWAAGLSIFGTQLSAITFMAIPAKSFATDWVFFVGNLGILAVAPIVVALYLPRFRRENATTAYEYLEERFSPTLRLYGSASFILFQLARMGIVVFLPALALAAVTGLDVRACIVIMGVLCTLYTVLGGIEAVIWTDVLQVIVLLAGALFALALILARLDGSLGDAWATARDAGKLRLADTRWDWTAPTIGVLVVSALFNNLVPYTSDQAVIQRFLTTKDEAAAKRAVWLNALVSMPASLLFFGVGTALWLFYRERPAALDPFGATDQIFPWFIVHELPAGVAGLLIAGVFAAAMSSLDSSMNSIATAGVTDFYRRFRPDADDARCLRVAKRLTIFLGVLGTAAALAMAAFDVRSLLDLFLSFVGLLGGGLAGLFALGVFTRRVGASAAWVGVLLSSAALLYAKFMTPLHGLAYAGVGVGVCFVGAWLASFALPAGPRTEVSS